MAFPLAPLLTFLATGTGLVKAKKANVVWYQSIPGAQSSWIMKSGPMSARQCKKTIAKLVSVVGLDPARLEYFRKGVNPNKTGG